MVELAGPDLRGQRVLDALACGVPVVVDEHAGVANLVREGAAGVTVDTADEGALASVLRLLIVDPPRRAAAARAARALARSLPGWEEALLPLLAEGPPAAAGEGRDVAGGSRGASGPLTPRVNPPGATGSRRASA
jgi:hypothetical protein